MTDEHERASLANEARLDAKAFRENTVYGSEGDPIRLIANANRLDQYADRIEALVVENARLRKELEAASDFIGNLDHTKAGEKVYRRIRAALKDTRHDADA